jgi:deoxyribodipyrimidine photo-lyase
MQDTQLTSKVPALRVRSVNAGPVRAAGEWVLYWMTANRRTGWNYSLDRAIEWAVELGKPLVVLETLRCDDGWASDRFHLFAIQGMIDNGAALKTSPVTYYPYLERQPGGEAGLLSALADRACVVVADDFPCGDWPQSVAAAAQKITCRWELVDSNGLLPLRATDKVFLRAFDFRRFLQKSLVPHLAEVPCAKPQAAGLPRLGKLPEEIVGRWPMESAAELARLAGDLSGLPIDHTVGPGLQPGGSQAAGRQLDEFLQRRLHRYADERNQPQEEVASGLSPYLHFGHISAHEVFAEVADSQKWNPGRLATKATGSATGWWGLDAAAESFLDELITWREIGYNMSALRDDYAEYASLPDWVQQTLAKHAADPRPSVYTLDQFAESRTHDPLWNAAQRQLVREGRMHNYLRMLWGKKILHWSPTPQDALAVMIELNNKYALDGRNPNSYSGIFWVLGRYDRPWGPERPIFGTIRYMSSDNTARKVKVGEYLQWYGAEGQRGLF